MINELTSATLTLTFRDSNGVAAIPSVARYQIDDLSSGITVVEWTDFTPSVSSYDISITGAQNSILNRCNEIEDRRVTVIAYYTDNTQCTLSFKYSIKNLRGLPPIQVANINESGSSIDSVNYI